MTEQEAELKIQELQHLKGKKYFANQEFDKDLNIYKIREIVKKKTPPSNEWEIFIEFGPYVDGKGNPQRVAWEILCKYYFEYTEIKMITVKELYEKNIQQLIILSGSCMDKCEAINIENPEWQKNKDIRFEAFEYFFTVFTSCKLSSHQYLKYVSSEQLDDYLKEVAVLKLEKEKEYLRAVDTYLRFAFFHQTYNVFESSVKIIIRHHENKIFSKTKIKPFITQTLQLAHHDDFLKLMGGVRNSIHNNGFFFPDVEPNFTELPFKGKKYKLIVGERIDFSWDDAFVFAEEMIKIWEDIILSENIIKITETIKI